LISGIFLNSEQTVNSFPGLVFNQNEELTGPNTSNSKYTVRYQNGIFAPTDEAFQNLLDDLKPLS